MDEELKAYILLLENLLNKLKNYKALKAKSSDAHKLADGLKQKLD